MTSILICLLIPMFSRTKLVASLGFISCTYLVLIYLARRRQRQIFFHPSRKLINSIPDTLENKDYVEGMIQGYLNYRFYKFYDDQKTILFFHGSSGNMTSDFNRKSLVLFCKKYAYNLFMIDFRGYGKSYQENSTVTAKTICEDAEVAYQHLIHVLQIKPNDVIVWGQSLGGLPASHLCLKHSVEKLILMSTFTNPYLLLSTYTGQDLTILDKILYYMMKPFLEKMDIYENLIRMQNKVPTIILHSKSDEIIPFQNGMMNFKQINHQKSFLTIDGLHTYPLLNKEELENLNYMIRH